MEPQTNYFFYLIILSVIFTYTGHTKTAINLLHRTVFQYCHRTNLFSIKSNLNVSGIILKSDKISSGSNGLVLDTYYVTPSRDAVIPANGLKSNRGGMVTATESDKTTSNNSDFIAWGYESTPGSGTIPINTVQTRSAYIRKGIENAKHGPVRGNFR